jgi:NAD(P)H-hydrate repair Nnr-like enzyme with NAD(P)H-hydrate dehydratase domain
VLTPHDREFARFGSDVGDDRIGAARRLAEDVGAVVLLKGDATVVTDGRQVVVNDTGSAVLATAGSGDVLCGGIGALLAQGLGPVPAAAVGAHVHGAAGRLSARGATTSASSLLEAWPAAVRAVRAGTLGA